MPDQVTAAQFAQEIKKKYPQYAKVPDEQLARAMVEKYPSYAKQVTFGAQPKDTVSAAPKFGVKDALEIAIARPTSPAAKSAVMTGIDRALPFLPAASATVGGILAGPESGFMASVPVAAAFGATGELLREKLNHAIFGEDEPNVRDEATKVGVQAVLGGMSEFGARGSGKVIGKVLKPFAEAAPTVKAAKAGTGVRMTPGEASGSSVLKRVEELLTHIPGGAGPMEAFRDAQLADVNRMTASQVQQLATNRMTDEQAGQMVQQSLKQASADAGAKFDEVKKLLGVDPKTHMTPEEINAAVAKKVEFYKQMNGGTPPVVQALADARRAYRAPGGALTRRLAKAQPEEIVTLIERKTPLAQLRQFNTLVPEPARRQIQANLLQKILTESSDAQSGVLDQRALAKALKRLGPERGKLIFGQQWNALQEGSALLNKIAPMATNQTGGLGKMHTMRTLIEVGGVAGAALGLSHGAYTAAAAVGGPMLAMRLISSALAHPQASAMMLKVLRGAAMTSARAIPYGVDALAISPADVHTQAAAQ